MEFKDYAKNPSLYWACSTCIFPGEISINETTFELPSEGTGNSPADDDPLQDRNLMGNIKLDPVEPGAEGIPENTELERLRNQHKKELLIAHLNINSIQNKFEELCKIIKDLQIHVMFISETKIDSSYPDSQFSMAGYSLYRNDRKKGGGGIMALISTALVKKRLKINKNYKTVETLAFEIKTNKGNMVILGIYRPPTLLCGNYRLELENELSELCNWASLQANFVVVLGDLNLDRLKPEKPEGKLLLDLEAEQDFKCLITQPTRVEKRGDVITKTLIDVLLSNKPELFKCAGNYYPCLSDHALIYGVLKERINQNKPKVISFRSYKNFDADSYKKMLEMAPWHVGELFDETEDQVNYWNSLMNDILDEVAPVKTMRVRDKDVPYMTTGWKSAIRAKRKANAKYLKDKTPENWELRRRARNEATQQRRKAIKEYWRLKTADLKDNPKEFFKTFKPFLSTKGCKASEEILLNENGEVIKDQKQVAEVFVEHFASIADGIGGDAVKCKNVEDFENHPSVLRSAPLIHSR
ncbi:uncharacterized protein LOC125561124 [Nematostella vectensis]|uniref:uncharacterized protein LOC125561124 n=1 Tax=Nematostella vectensis TaxID=45351 RepID=UPI0020777B55|nr:uncharacterized protein LOC125561124 [Nematostella vectensis]